MKEIQETIIRDTVDWWIPYEWDRWSSGNPCLSLQRVRKNSSLGSSDLGLPGLAPL